VFDNIIITSSVHTSPSSSSFLQNGAIQSIVISFAKIKKNDPRRKEE